MSVCLCVRMWSKRLDAGNDSKAATYIVVEAELLLLFLFSTIFYVSFRCNLRMEHLLQQSYGLDAENPKLQKILVDS